MYRKIVPIVVSFGILITLLCGCGNASEEATITTQEVVFLNRIAIDQPYDMSESGFSGVWSRLEFDEEVDDDALYAYRVNGLLMNEKDKMLNILKKEGFLFVQDYPNSAVVVAGKMEDFERVFLRGEKYKGFYWGAEAVERPDMEGVLKEYCGDGIYYESMYSYSWVNEHFEELVPILGTDKNRVSIEVTLSTSWEEESE